MIPPEADIIGTSSEFNYSCEPKNYRTAYAFNAADRISYASWNEGYTCSISEFDHSVTIAPYNNSWTVDFGSSKTILNFGVSVPNYSDANGNYFPSKDWFLLGSGDELGHGAFGLYIKEALIKCDCGFLPWQAKNLAGNLRTRRKILCFIYTAYKGRNR